MERLAVGPLRRLVVGVDGSADAARALDWSAATVGPRGSIHAVAALPSMDRLAVDVVMGDTESYVRHVRHELSETWVSAARATVGQLTTEVREDGAADALAHAAVEIDAGGIVVGAHARTGMSLPVVGQTTRHLLRELTTPLIVVPEGVDVNLDDGQPLVAGVGHGEATEAAVWWTSEVADDRGLPVGLIRATGDAPVFQADGLVDLLGYYFDAGHREQLTRGDLSRLAQAIQENSEHELVIEAWLRPGLPAVQLVVASEHAAMLVIGHHWSAISHGHFTAQPLRYALRHTRCPIAVVPEAAVHSR